VLRGDRAERLAPKRVDYLRHEIIEWDAFTGSTRTRQDFLNPEGDTPGTASPRFVVYFARV